MLHFLHIHACTCTCMCALIMLNNKIHNVSELAILRVFIRPVSILAQNEVSTCYHPTEYANLRQS